MGVFRHANRVLDNADQAIAEAKDSALQALELAKALIKDIEDGVTLEVTVFGKPLPINVRLIPDEEAAKLKAEGGMDLQFTAEQVMNFFMGARKQS